MNYFQLLNLEQKYEIDLKILDQQYFAKLSEYHPDKARTIAEKQQFLAISIDLNKAYSTLKDDLERAQYLLKINGIEMNDAEIRTRLSPAQLSSIWEELEIVEEANSLKELEQNSRAKMQDKQMAIDNLNEAFNHNNLQDALDITIRLKYLTNLINNIKAKIKDASNRD